MSKAPKTKQEKPPQTTEELLKNADPEQVKALTSKSLALWAQYSGIEVDGRAFEFDKHRYLLPIYLDNHHEIVWQKAAQLGATIYLLLRLLWFCRHYTLKAGLYFPTGEGVEVLSKDRLTPLINSNAELHNNVRSDANTLGLKQIDNAEGRRSSLYMLYVGGRASKDSVPLDVVAFDEVRLIESTDIDQALERISHSSFKHKMFMSTAGLPSCFSGDTAVVVRDKLSNLVTRKTIKELVDNYENYQVLSYYKGGGPKRLRYRDLKGAICRGKREVVKVTFWGGHEVVCTPDHHFAKKHFHGTNDYFKSIKWEPISNFDLMPNSYGGHKNSSPPSGVLVANSIPLYKNASTAPKIVDSPISLKTAKVLGIYTGEGHLIEKSNAIVVSQNVDNFDVYNPIIDWASSEDLYWSVKQPVAGQKMGSIYVSLSRRPDLLDYFMDCGQGAANKKVPEIVLNGSDNQIEAFLEGLVLGDGHIRGARDKSRQSFRQWDIYTSSKRLADELCYLGIKTGKPLSRSVRDRRGPAHIEGNDVNINYLSYCVSYNPNSFRNREVLPGLGELGVRKIEPYGEEVVYDLEVDQDPWFVLADSGCLVHNSDINARFLRGTQHTWMMRCGCPKTHEDQGYFDPAETWPDSVIETKDGALLRCPRCKFTIKDPQNGGYIVRNPGADAHSYRVSQLASRFITLKEIWEFYKTTTHMAEFYNAKLGLPYVDAENRPVSEDVFNACINPELDWSTAYNDVQKRKHLTAMGVDQHAGNCYAVITKQGKDGKKELLHLELIESDNPEYWKPHELTGDLQPVSPFERLKELMYEFNVNMCVVDAMPNANEAQNFARSFPGKVFIAWYRESQGGDLISWADRPKHKETVKKGSEQIKLKWQVVINRYQGIDFALRQFVDGQVQVPPLSKFSVICRHPKTGRFEHVELAKIFRNHMTRLVRHKTIIDEVTQRYRMDWAELGGQTHFTHAWLYCCAGFERLQRRAKFVF